jgi:TRAP-type C4-dicarboxylate transport system permease small subunit
MKPSYPTSKHGRDARGANASPALAVSILVISIALILTVGAAIDLINQVLAAPNLKAGLITLVLHLGMVLLGPALLLAYVNLIPRENLPRALETARIGAFATRSQADSAHR